MIYKALYSCNDIDNPICQEKTQKYAKKIKVSKVGNRSRGQPEGSLFNSYYTEV